ncbi:MAG TPA: hypothetical protein VK638_46315 [Edaphobacter sp.]|nr:hypothetical protein [Edaphobacter sp.]
MASDQTDPVLKVSLRKYADECITRADEIEDGEIASSIAEEEEPLRFLAAESYADFKAKGRSPFNRCQQPATS